MDVNETLITLQFQKNNKRFQRYPKEHIRRYGILKDRRELRKQNATLACEKV